MVKSGKSFVKIEYCLQKALFFLFYRNFQPPLPTPPIDRQIDNNRMKMKDRTLMFTHNRFCCCCFSSVYKSYHFVLLISRSLGIKYEADFILRTHYFSRFCDFSLFIEQRFKYLYEIIFIRFS